MPSRVSQDLILGLRLFNIFFDDWFSLFLSLKFVILLIIDDSTLHSCIEVLGNILRNLTIYILRWFQLNLGKFQFMILGKKVKNDLLLCLNETNFEKSHEVVFLEVTTEE